MAGLFSRKKKYNDPPAMPSPLDRIRYVQVDYVRWPDMDQGTMVFEGTVSWYMGGWEIFIDSSTFGNDMVEKKNFVFLDADKKPLPMQGFSCTAEVVNEGDCGKVKIHKA